MPRAPLPSCARTLHGSEARSLCLVGQCVSGGPAGAAGAAGAAAAAAAQGRAGGKERRHGQADAKQQEDERVPG